MNNNGYTKSVPEIVMELKTEVQEFIATRVAMFRSEAQEKVRSLKLIAPMAVVGLAVVWTAWLVFTGFLVAVIGQAFTPRPWAYVLALILVAFGYALIGTLMVYAAWKKMSASSLKPEHTIRVLQQDKLWIQAEGKAQL